jgi:hypothetical protein
LICASPKWVTVWHWLHRQIRRRSVCTPVGSS